jgi:hypothetical protein
VATGTVPHPLPPPSWERQRGIYGKIPTCCRNE